MHAYADVVLNHRMGGDETEEVEIEEIDCDNRNCVVSEPYKIRAWSHYKFPGRGDKYSTFKWHWQHFNAFGANADTPDETGKIYRVVGKTFTGEVCFEFGNFDYLMGADVDTYHADVREELFRWGEWFVDIDRRRRLPPRRRQAHPGQLLQGLARAHARARSPDRELFAVGEYWSGDVDELQGYLAATDGVMRLFDVPLHFRLHEASKKGRDFDLSKIFDGTLVKDNPLMAVTFVDNHDSQPGQSLRVVGGRLVQAAGVRADPAPQGRLPLPLLRRLLRQRRRRSTSSSRTAS